MNNQEVRKYLHKGESAVKLLESMGYQFKEPNRYTRPEWIAPEVKEDSLEKAIKELVLKETSKAVEESLNHQRKELNGQGPNWWNVRQLVGKKFTIPKGIAIWVCKSITWDDVEGVYKVHGTRPEGRTPWQEGITHNLKGLIWRD